MAGLCRLSDPGALRETVAALAETGCDEFVLVPTTDDIAELDRLELALGALARVPRMGCGCLLALLAMLSPRLAIFFVWLFTDRMSDRVQRRSGSACVGFLFLPWTTLAWALAYQPGNGRHRVRLVHRDLRVLVDLRSYAASAQARRTERAAD